MTSTGIECRLRAALNVANGFRKTGIIGYRNLVDHIHDVSRHSFHGELQLQTVEIFGAEDGNARKRRPNYFSNKTRLAIVRDLIRLIVLIDLKPTGRNGGNGILPRIAWGSFTLADAIERVKALPDSRQPFMVIMTIAQANSLRVCLATDDHA